MSTQERLMQFLAHKHMSKLRFANIIGRSPSYVTNIVEGIGASTMEVIKDKFPELNIEWLQTGKGEMINTPAPLNVQPNIKQTTVYVLPVSAQAGRLTDFVESVSEFDCEKMVSPINDAEFAITITGDSMAPEYQSGSKALISKVNEKAFIDWGKTYVLDTCNGIVVKNVFPGSSEGKIKCVSINPNYPSFEVDCADIYGWYRVLMCLSLK